MEGTFTIRCDMIRDAKGANMKVETAVQEDTLDRATPGVHSFRFRFWPESSTPNAIPALDGLRAIAVLLVLVFHAWNDLPNFIQPGQNPYSYPLNYGRTGVHLFFVLSGFLLFLPYARWMFGLQPRPSTRLFYRRRILRVGPAYWTCLAILVFAAPLTIQALGDAVLHVFFLSNALPQTLFSINGVFWTMAVEVQFYAILPLIAWVMVKASHRLRTSVAAAAVIGCLFVISLCSEYAVKVASLSSIPVLSGLMLGEYSLPYWLAIFGAGISCSVVYVYLTNVRRLAGSAATPTRLWGIIALAIGCVTALSLAFVPADHRLPGKDLLFGGAYAAILFGVLCGPAWASWLLRTRPIRFIGLISYSCYLWHAIIINGLEARLPAGMGTSEKVLIACLVGGPAAIACAYVSYQLTERPFLRARKRAREIPATTEPALAPISSVVR